MFKIFLKIIIAALIPLTAFPQGGELYHEGVYNTFSDFQNKKPNSPLNFTIHRPKNIITVGFQLRDEKNKYIKKPFAVSNGEILFVNVGEMQKLIKKTQNVGNHLGSRWDYLPAHFADEELLYFENYFVGVGRQIIGGKVYLTGIVYDFSRKTFTVLNTNEKVNSFISENYPKLIEEYRFSGKLVDLDNVRKLIHEIVTHY